MVSESRGTVTTFSSGTQTAVTLSAFPGPQSYVLVVVGTNAPTITVTGVAPTSGPGLFVQLAAINSAGKRLELWVGYNFGSTPPTIITVTRSAVGNSAVVLRVIDVLTDATIAPIPTASTGSTATSTTADSGTLTPAVGDILIAAALMASTTADSTARTHTGNNYLQNTGSELTTLRIETGWCEVIAAVASKEVWTLAASVEWAAIQVKITPPAAPTPTAALLLKGLTTQAADAASIY
jgi:hypothetical protein